MAAANKEAGDAKARNRGIQKQLNKERKEWKNEKERHERELKKEKEDSERKGNILRIRLEKDNPLKGTVSQLEEIIDSAVQKKWKNLPCHDLVRRRSIGIQQGKRAS